MINKNLNKYLKIQFIGNSISTSTIKHSKHFNKYMLLNEKMGDFPDVITSGYHSVYIILNVGYIIYLYVYNVSILPSRWR